MPTFFFLLPLIFLALLISTPSLSALSSTPTIISAAPAKLPDDHPAAPLMSPYNAEISPDIAPQFPSPGSNTIPTIPSNPSSNPDEVSSVGPDPAFAPEGSLPLSSAVNLLSQSESVKFLIKFLGFLSFFALQALAL